MNNIEYYSAGAGSGKTYTLTHIIADLIEKKDAKPEEMILTTFTELAAGEFKEKTKAVLYGKAKTDSKFDGMAERVDLSMIGTVHGVCNAFINKYWFMLGLSPDMRVLTEEDVEFYMDQSIANLPTEQEVMKMNEFRDFFDIKDSENKPDYNFWKSHLKNIIEKAENFQIDDLKQSKTESLNMIDKFRNNGRNDVIDENEVKSIIKFLKDNDTAKGNKTRENSLSSFERDSSKITLALTDRICTYISKLPAKVTNVLNMTQADAFTAKYSNIWKSVDVNDRIKEYVELIFDLAEKWKKEYADYKRQKHLIDYDDMEKYMYDLLQNKDVKDDIKNTYHYLLVDEFQDSSPMQVKIFDQLSDLMNHSYFVGDYKQSIYGFRGTDIELVMAACDKIAKTAGCSINTLPDNHRSVPEIVKACNETFANAFQGVLKRNQVVLNPTKPSLGKDCLKTWVLSDNNKDDRYSHLAKNIAMMLAKNVCKPKDIAVLGNLSNANLDIIASKLEAMGIPVDRDFNTDSSAWEVQLVTSLLSLIVNPNDNFARATIAFLTENGMGTGKILDTKLEYDGKNEYGTFLSGTKLIDKMVEKRKSLRLLPVSAIVENVIIEMGLYNSVLQMPDSNGACEKLHAIIGAAKQYEDHCKQMSVASTVSGFIDYINISGISYPGKADGVKVMTIHKSKGLQFKNVILFLDSNSETDNKIIVRNCFGVKFHHASQPDASNLYPDTYLTLVPNVFGSSIQEEIVAKIYTEREKKDIIDKERSEERRLFYVAMTRAEEELILAVSQSNRVQGLKPILEFSDQGGKAEDFLADGYHDCLGIGVDFLTETPHDKAVEDETTPWHYVFAPVKIFDFHEISCEQADRDIQPSSFTDKSTQNYVPAKDFQKRLITVTGAKDDDMAAIGSCIHDAFCVMDTCSNNDIERIVKDYKMEAHILYPKEIREAYDALTKYLTTTYGTATGCRHELSFKQWQDGQIITGSIDFVWETEKGDVLVDFKNFPGQKDMVLDPAGDHYVGNYLGQLDCYTRALKAQGRTVLDRLIFYSVIGLIVKL